MNVREYLAKKYLKILGGIALLIVCVDFFGIVDLSAPEGFTEKEQAFYGAIGALALFVLPPEWISKLFQGVANKRAGTSIPEQNTDTDSEKENG